MFNSIAPQPSLHQSAEDEQELVQTRLQRSRFISTHQVKISSKRKSESSESLSHSEIRVIKRSIFQTEGMDPAHKPTNKSYSSKDEHGNENKDWRSNSLVEPEGDHEIRQVKTSFRLPWWFIYITWINLVSLNIFLAYYIMLYGLSLGYEKNVDWTLAFFTGFLTDILFLQPVKVVLIVFILILILKQKYSLRDAAPVTKHKESLELLYHYKKLNNKIGTKTQKIVYQSPLHSSDFKNVLERLKIESLAIEMIRDFFLYTIFMIFILLLVYAHMDIFARFHQIRFTKHHYLGIYDPLNVNDMEEDLFMEIHDASGMWSYLNDVLLTRLIPNERNNSLKESLYLFGTVRLRQTRVKPDSGACSNLPETIRMIYNTEICIHSMEDGQEENNSFVNSWKVVYEDYVEDLEDSPFVYKSAEQLRTASFSGQRATYSGGGFVANFSRDNIQEARITLDTIKQSKWLDQYTRCIFVEFTLFNPGTDLFISVVLAFEFDGTGGLFPFYAVSAARIYQDNARKEYWLQISEGITIICVIFYTIVEINAIIQQGIYDYLKSFWNWLEIAVLCLTYIIGIIYLFRLIAYLDAINIFRVYGHARFIDLQTVFFRDNVFNHCMGLLGALTIFKMLKVISFNPLLMTYTKTIHTIRADFAAYIAIVVVLLFAFSMFGTIIFGPYIFGYMSLDRALFNLMFFILKKTDFQNLVTVNRFLGRVFFLLGLVVTQYIIINFFIALLGEGLALVKHMSFQIENAALMHTLSILLPFIITPDNSKR